MSAARFDLCARPEIQLVLGLAGGSRTATAIDVHRRDFDWRLALDFARSHRLLPLFARRAAAALGDALPAFLQRRLAEASRQFTIRALSLTGELRRILRQFTAEGIPIVPYKGPVLAYALHGDPSLRECDDLDLVVRPGDVLPAKRALAAVGYRPEAALRPGSEAALFGSLRVTPDGPAWSFRRPEALAPIEIHWRLADRFFPDSVGGDCWQRVKHVPFLDQSVLSFSAEDLLLALCSHGTKHVWQRLDWICDIARLAVEPTMDWQRVRQEAARLGGWRMVCLGLHLAKRYFDIELTGKLQRQVAEPSVAMLADRVHESLFGDRGCPTPLATLRFHLDARERLRDRIRYCLDLALTPTIIDWQSTHLPPRLAILLPLCRAFRVGRKFGLPGGPIA